MTEEKQPGWELTGRHVLIFLLLFFGITIAVNAYFTVRAVQSFPGEDVKQSYRQGLEYNKTLEARAKQDALNWSARVNVVTQPDDTPLLIVQLNDADGAGLTRASVTGKLRHQTNTELDRDVIFEDTGAGRFTTSLAGLAGQYKLQAVAEGGEDIFRFEHDLLVK